MRLQKLPEGFEYRVTVGVIFIPSMRMSFPGHYCT